MCQQNKPCKKCSQIGNIQGESLLTKLFNRGLFITATIAISKIIDNVKKTS